MANRTVIVDNNTWNNTHIATVGTAMSSPEKAAWEIFDSLDVKYVLVVFGGWFFMDLGKKRKCMPETSNLLTCEIFFYRAGWLP
jgi:hypothetical protein